MIRIVNVKEEIMYTVSLVADISYAWDIIRTYVGYMQDGIHFYIYILFVVVCANFVKL